MGDDEGSEDGEEQIGEEEEEARITLLYLGGMVTEVEGIDLHKPNASRGQPGRGPYVISSRYGSMCISHLSSQMTCRR